VQARTHALAFHEGLGVKVCRLASRTPAKAEALAQSLRQAGLDARAVEARELPGMLSESPLVVTATTATEPVIPDRVPDDAFLAAVGSFSPRAAEIPAGLVRRAQVYVDDLKAAQEEAGDLIRAGVDFGRITPLEDVADGVAQRPDAGKGPVLFKSVGHALFDLAAARLAMSFL
jgi:ornithine cyclodeaminase